MNDKQALISVSDKKGIINFTKELTKLGVKIISTGGTATVLRKAGIKLLEVTEITNFPEILNGRVKTEHPKLIGGILALRSNKKHMDELKKYEIKPIDLNLLVKYTSDTFGAARKEIVIHQELAEDLSGIMGDTGQIEQVLLNLYVNAADAMPGGGDLFIKTKNATHEDMTGKQYKAKIVKKPFFEFNG